MGDAPVSGKATPVETLYLPFTPGYDEPQLTREERGRGASFEWWYFDAGTPDGVDIDLFFTLKNPVLHRTKASLLVEYQDAETKLMHVVNFPASEFDFRKSNGRRELRIADNSVIMTGELPEEIAYQVDLVLPDIEVHLKATPIQGGFVPAAEGRYFRGRADPNRYSAVSFSAPMMRVEGQVVVRGRRVDIRQGRGYHDHPWGTQQMMWTHEKWHWGRMSSDQEGVMFAVVHPSPDFEGQLRFLYEGAKGTFAPHVSQAIEIGAEDWRKLSWHGIACPHQLTVKAHRQAWNGRFISTLLDTPLYNRSKFTWSAAPAAEVNTGWVEYYEMRAWARWLVFWGARLLTFFHRPFPFFGR